MQKQKKNGGFIALCVIGVVLLMGAATAAGVFLAYRQSRQPAKNAARAGGGKESGSDDGSGNASAQGSAEGGSGTDAGGRAAQQMSASASRRKVFLANYSSSLAQSPVANVPEYVIEAGLSNVVNLDQYSFSAQGRDILQRNGFLVIENGDREFFSLYESNKYWKRPNFVTVDSMMHSYHLYFQHLLKNTERKHLAPRLLSLSEGMQQVSEAQYNALRGSEWESAARRNLAFFSLGHLLLDPAAEIPAEVQEMVSEEHSLIEGQGGAAVSPISGNVQDYSQYIVRGYYEGDAELERYFRAMMWYGQVSFLENEEDLDRSALLMTTGLYENPAVFSDWEAIYAVTSFFTGASDDNGYYEYEPLAEEAYGAIPAVQSLPGDSSGWDAFHTLTASTPAPKINSTASLSAQGESGGEPAKAFRFMGQRFTIDGTIFQNLVYSYISDKPDGSRRELPNALDIPAAFGSEEALAILAEKGETAYGGYSAKMDQIRAELMDAPDSLWTASLASLWLRTLQPLTEQRGKGYPMFMQTQAWRRKNLQSFLGSYTELKHDTILYAKQAMAEMSEDAPPDREDHGYVEPEAELFHRLAALTQSTYEGLQGFDMLDQKDGENLQILQTLCERLAAIADKELRNETPTEEEYALIETYGDQISHFWEAAFEDESGEYGVPTTQEFPAPIIADVANGGGETLELATGRAAEIYVVVPVDGSLRIASGTVFQFYQFAQPAAERLTDTEWRQMMGFQLSDDGTYVYENYPHSLEDWTSMFEFKPQDVY